MSLLRAIERHLSKTGTKAAPFGREAVGDPRLVFDLRRGREPGPRVVKRALALIEKREGKTCER